MVNPIIEAVTATGRSSPRRGQISPVVSGEIVELHLKEGDFVQKGALLFRIKPEIYISSRDRAAATLNSTKSRLAQAEAQLAQAELAYKRNKNLFEESTISKSDFEQAEAQYKVAKAEKESAEFSVKAPRHHLRRQTRTLSKRQSIRHDRHDLEACRRARRKSRRGEHDDRYRGAPGGRP